MGNYTDGNTRTCGLFGYPVRHTMSPFIHNMLAEMTGINMVYVPFEVKPENLGDAVRGIEALNVLGVNCTIPHKSEVIQYLAEVDDLAQKVGAVNTLVRLKDGRGYKGYNTDMTGVQRSLRRAGVELKGESVVILGAGGVSRPIAYLCAANGAKDVYILNRTVEKAEAVAAEVNAAVDNSCVKPMKLEDYDKLPRDRKYLAFQCTSVGLYPNVDDAPVTDESFYELIHTAFDAIYRPIETRFLKMAADKGAKCIGGLEMLLFQGIDAFELWNDVSITDKQADIVYDALLRKTEDKGNVILVGFMGCGKSTVSACLSDKLGITAIDTDDMIEKEESRTIKDIFANEGEEAFRDMETAYIQKLIDTEVRDHIIAVGGGLPLRSENRRLLKKLGQVVYLKTSPNEAYKRLQGDTTRPLLQGDDLMGRILKLSDEREEMYQDSADHIVITDSKCPEEIAEEINKLIRR